MLRTAGRWQRPLAIRDVRRISIGERRSHISNAWRAAFVPLIRDVTFHSDEEPEERLDASTRLSSNSAPETYVNPNRK